MEQFQNTHSEPTLFSLIRCESVFITMYPYRDADRFSDESQLIFFTTSPFMDVRIS